MPFTVLNFLLYIRPPFEECVSFERLYHEQKLWVLPLVRGYCAAVDVCDVAYNLVTMSPSLY